ncbi:MAG: hypothetical protein HW402_1339 [Dehalococcoidales bacterium]|nr:hypothetical protein [Dehalococcoidales bacterium]
MSSIYGERFDPSTETTGAQNMYMRSYLEPFINSTYESPVMPWLLEKWTMAPDALSWTLTIRKGVKFHNGDAFTAKDAKFTLERYMAKGYAHAGTLVTFKSVEVVDDYTARLYTTVPQPFVVDILMREGALVVPKDYFERVGAPGYQRQPVGTGNWKFSRHVLGDMFEFEAVENHWKKTPEFKKLSLILIPEMATRVAMLKSGAVDATDIGLEEVAGLEAAGFKTIRGGDPQVPVVNILGAYEPGAGIVGDVRVRQALSLSINREEIAATFFHGKATMPVLDNMGPLSGDVDYAYWRDYSAKMYRYDLVEAKRLLKEAGYPDGFSLKFYSMPVSGSPFLPALAEIVQAYWLRAGIKAQIIPIDTALFYTFRNVTKTPTSPAIGTASIYRITGEGYENTGRSFLNPYHTKDLFGQLGSGHPEIDGLIDSVQSELDPVKRKAINEKILRITADAWVRIGIANVPSMFGLGSNVDFDDMPKANYHLSRVAYLFRHGK